MLPRIKIERRSSARRESQQGRRRSALQRGPVRSRAAYVCATMFIAKRRTMYREPATPLSAMKRTLWATVRVK
eukprot:2224905-Prymnesium_polylepis.2